VKNSVRHFPFSIFHFNYEVYTQFTRRTRRDARIHRPFFARRTVSFDTGGCPFKPCPENHRTACRISGYRRDGIDGREKYGSDNAVVSRRGRLFAFFSNRRRSPDTAIGVFHVLHAVSAGDITGHAAIHFRISNADLPTDRDGGRKRIDVRRLNRNGRSLPDGATRNAAGQDRRCRHCASRISRRR
jgi:hypothetical protein